jgi:thiosulfate reductase cytochrome b subunit
MAVSDGTATETGEAPRGGVRVLRWILNFLMYGANTRPGEPRVPFYRHPLFVRLSHWVNAGVLLVMVMSGLQIFNAHPALYWGRSADFDHPILSLTAQYDTQHNLRGITQIGSWKADTTGTFGYSDVDGQPTVRGFPEWMTLPGVQWLAMGRQWHFFFAWFFVLNGLLFLVLALCSGHAQRDLFPKKTDFTHLPREILQHALLRFPKGEAAKSYNGIQRLTYFFMIFIIGPLVVLTGLTMSPTMDAAFPPLIWLWGRQTARTIHFLCAFSFVAFFLVHIALVLLSGAGNGIRSMITGWWYLEKDGGTHG